MPERPDEKYNIFNIPSGASFLDVLAQGLLSRIQNDPLELATYTIFLPTRRGCVEFQNTLQKHYEGEALLLPRLIPLGELDAEEEFILNESVHFKPVMPAFKRLGLMCQLILKYTENSNTAPHSMESALELARMLLSLLDQASIEEVSWEKLRDLVPEDFASHWQITLQFLNILVEHWPEIIEKSGYTEPHEARAETIDALIKRLNECPPEGHYIVAGSTGTMPATRRLIHCISALPHGEVILPGLDATCHGQELEASHPQYALYYLLQELDVDPLEIKPWMSSLQPSPRAELFRDSLNVDKPRTLPQQSLDHVHLIECKGRAEEALSIALLLRETLETPGKTAALITPDRKLATQVATELKRWDIAIDDSAGESLQNTPTGIYLRVVLDAAAQGLKAVPLLTLMKNPFTLFGQSRVCMRQLARDLELHHLRGLEKTTEDLLGEIPEDSLVRDIICALKALSGKRTLAEFIEGHLEIAERLSQDGNGTTSLWTGPRGEQFQQFFADLLENHHAFPDVTTLEDYQQLFQCLLRGKVARPYHRGHPRLKILGSIEARLSQADRVVLGGLNEGSWPPEITSDPWLSRPMREKLGFPPVDRRIGLSAHDFGQGFAAGEVFMTRSLREDGTPTIPCRWLSALDVHLQKYDQEFRRDHSVKTWTSRIDQPDSIKPIAPPRPCPPVSARPRTFSVTAVERWMRDPYSLYAKSILGLRPMDPIARPLSVADRGNFVHRVFELFLSGTNQTIDELLRIGREVFAPHMSSATVAYFWWPRFCEEARWFIDHLPPYKTHLETKGSLSFGDVILYAKADRVDEEHGLRIIDYKTGQPPSVSEVELGYSPQLSLEGLIASKGGFQEAATTAVDALEYWHIKGEKSRVLSLKNSEKLIQEAEEGFQHLLTVFDDPSTPYLATPNPSYAPRYNDCAHLARTVEWENQATDDEVSVRKVKHASH